MRSEEWVFRLTDAVPAPGYSPFEKPINLEMRHGETWLITGANGSGKTTLGKVLAKAVRLKAGSLEYGFDSQRDALYVGFQDELAGALTFHQLKWNQGMREDEEQRVADLICGDEQEAFGLEQLADRPVISLSTGELRRVQLVLVLKRHPKLLILDDPATGLDIDAAQVMWEALKMIADKGETAIVVIAPVAPAGVMSFSRTIVLGDVSLPRAPLVNRNPVFSIHTPNGTDAPIVEMKNVTVVYGGRTILKDVNWTIRQGEQWVVRGKNGSGKTTLLSLLTGDNPNAYGQDIRMWGRRRGTGESIWDIKRRVGCLHAEVYRALRRPIAVDALVATALHEQNGLYHRLNDDDEPLIYPFLEAFGLAGIRKRLYTDLSTGEQHRVLLARTMAKRPELLILDEPFHCLDEYWIGRLLQIIDIFAAQGGTLLLVTHRSGLVPQCVTKELVLG